ncbi:MAG: hypothetical protein ACOYMN_03925, partial [Roseimicrobium sp.]
MRLILLLALGACLAQAQKPLVGTAPLAADTGEARSAAMVTGMDRFIIREIGDSVKKRESLWQRDLSSPEAYDKSVEQNRVHLRTILGVLEEDRRLPMAGLE